MTTRTMRHILKAAEVTFDEPLRLGLDPVAPSRDRQPPAASDGPGVRVAQSHAQYAILEVACSCGQTTYVRCDYGAANPVSTPPGPARTGRTAPTPGEQT